MTADLSPREVHEREVIEERDLPPRIARVVFPLIRQAFLSSRPGGATINMRRVGILVRALDATAPLIDADPNLEENEKLLIHGVFAMLVRGLKSNMLNERRLTALACFARFTLGLFEEAASFVELDIPEEGA